MPRTAVRRNEPQPRLSPESLPPIPAADNEPGAVAALLLANRALRQRRWPSPYDRTHRLGIES